MKMKKTLLILIILSLPLISKGSDNLVAVLYLKNGSYVSSDSVYTFLNLDGTMFDELRSRNGNEPTCLKIDRDNAVSYYPDLMIYVFFCKLSPNRKVLVRVGHDWKILKTNSPFTVLPTKRYLLSLDIQLRVGDILYDKRDKVKVKRCITRHIIDARGDYVAVEIKKRKLWFRWKRHYHVIPDRLLYN